MRGRVEPDDEAQGFPAASVGSPAGQACTAGQSSAAGQSSTAGSGSEAIASAASTADDTVPAATGSRRSAFGLQDRALDQACLLAGSPREVLARIVPGDPLDVRDAVVVVLRAECVFLDADRVHLRALARIARAGLRFAASSTPLATWIRAEVAGAVGEILREEVEAQPADPGTAFAQFARPLGLDPEAVRRGCAAFNRLPSADRAAFFALVVRSVGLDALARETGTPPSELGRRARRGLDAVLHANHPELPPATRSTTAAAPDASTSASAPTIRSSALSTDPRRTEAPA